MGEAAASGARIQSAIAKRREDVARAASYLFNRTWINLVFFSMALFSRVETSSVRTGISQVYSSSVFVLAASLVLCVVLHRQVGELFRRRGLRYLGPAITAVGIAIIAVGSASGSLPASAAIYASAVLTGFGSCLTFLFMGTRFAMVGTRECMLDVLAATAAVPALSMAVLALPYELRVAAIMALPFLAVLALRDVKAGPAIQAGADRRMGERVSPKMIVKFAVCAAILGITTSFMSDLHTAVPGDLSRQFDLSSLANTGVSVILLLFIAREKNPGIESLYRPTILICTAGFALCPLFVDDLIVPNVVVTTGYTLFEILAWVVMCEVARRFQYTSVQVFGFGRSLILIVGLIAGAFLSNLFVDMQDARSIAAFSAAAVISIALLRTYLLTSADLVMFERDLSIDEAPDERVEEPDADAPPKVPLAKRCAIIGQYYGLTPREIDVFCLLAVGRNSTRIQEELSISLGTVNTHTHHIFRKMDVHSQQELIDLFANAQLDELQERMDRR